MMNEFQECETCAANDKPTATRSIREPGAYGDFARLMLVIVVENKDTRAFYTTDGKCLGTYPNRCLES